MNEHLGEPSGSCRDLSSPGNPVRSPWLHVVQGNGAGDGRRGAADAGEAATGPARDDGGLGRVGGGYKVCFEIKRENQKDNESFESLWRKTEAAGLRVSA